MSENKTLREWKSALEKKTEELRPESWDSYKQGYMDGMDFAEMELDRIVADTPSVQSAPDTASRQEAIQELEEVLEWDNWSPISNSSMVTKQTIQTALSALKSEGKVQMKPVSELLKKEKPWSNSPIHDEIQKAGLYDVIDPDQDYQNG